MPEALLDALGVVEVFDVVAQGVGEFGSGGPGLGVVDPGQFSLQGGEE